MKKFLLYNQGSMPTSPAIWLCDHQMVIVYHNPDPAALGSARFPHTFRTKKAISVTQSLSLLPHLKRCFTKASESFPHNLQNSAPNLKSGTQCPARWHQAYNPYSPQLLFYTVLILQPHWNPSFLHRRADPKTVLTSPTSIHLLLLFQYDWKQPSSHLSFQAPLKYLEFLFRHNSKGVCKPSSISIYEYIKYCSLQKICKMQINKKNFNKIPPTSTLKW